MSPDARARLALAALAGILVVTASWWALALWPVGASAPDWFLRTREVCFGSTADALPTPAGWLLLIGQPAGMLAWLGIVWGAELRAGLALATRRLAGQLAVGVTLALVTAGIWTAVVRVRTAGLETFSTGTGSLASQLTRIDNAAPALALTDQSGAEISLESFRGRPVLVTFAFAHCETVCPLIVSDVLAARQRLDELSPEVLIVTLDPWRDTPTRLPSIAESWGLPAGAHVLSGPPDVVERALNAWRVPRVRNTKTGDISHPSIVYVVSAAGRIAYAIGGDAAAIAAAVRAL